MKIGVVGNRTGWTYEEVKEALDKLELSKADIIVSGGAKGVDEYAEKYAKDNELSTMIFYPTQSEPIPLRYFNRNRNIAITCDKLIAFDRKKGASGTKNTISYVKQLNKEITIIT